MTKKILITALFVAVCSVLIWGGVNRTLAKTDNTSEVSETTGTRRGQIDQNNDELIEGNETSGGRWGQKIQSEEIDVFEGNQIRGQNADGRECDEDPLTHEYNLSPVLYGNDIESSRGYQGGSNGEKTESGGGGGAR